MRSYIVGSTRTGKTNYLLDTIREPFAFIDPHGNAARELADAYPCIFWKPADLSYPVGFNPLQSLHPDLRWKVTAEIVNIFSDIWNLGPETPRLLYLPGIFGVNSTESEGEQSGIIREQIRDRRRAVTIFRGPLKPLCAIVGFLLLAGMFALIVLYVGVFS